MADRKRTPLRAPVAARLGSMVAAIEGSRAMIQIAQRSFDLLDERDRKLIGDASEMLGGVEQRIAERLWARTRRGGR